MDLNINIRVEVTPEFCKALDNIANTVTSAFCVTAATMQNTPAPVEEIPVAPVEAPALTKPKKAPEPPAENSPDFKAMRAELKSVMAKAAKEGKAEAVKALLAELGVTKLSQIPEDKLEEALEKAGGI